MTTAEEIVALAVTQIGKRYVYGTQPAANVADPPAFDCSGFTRWDTGRLGVYLPAGSWLQKDYCVAHGMRQFPPSEASSGMIVGHDGTGPDGHVAIVRGANQTIEARGAAYGVGSWGISGRPFQWAFRIPGVDYTLQPAPSPAANPQPLQEADMILIPDNAQPDPTIGNLVPCFELDVTNHQLVGLHGASVKLAKPDVYGRMVVPLPELAPIAGWGQAANRDGIYIVAGPSRGTYFYAYPDGAKWAGRP